MTRTHKLNGVTVEDRNWCGEFCLRPNRGGTGMLRVHKLLRLFYVLVLVVGSLCQTAYAKTISTVFDASITDATFKNDINFAVAEWNELLPAMPFTTTIMFDLKNIGGADTAGLTTYNTL